jgi:formylglycine-generating enzyme required for sulfatase activity
MMLLLLPALTEAQSVAKCPQPGPLSEAQLTDLAKSPVPAARVGQLVAVCGIDFEPTEEAISRLRSAGAPESVLAAVRSATGPATRKPRVVAGAKKVNPKDGLTYVWIPPGTFLMGCSPGDGECFSDERPAHEVTITRGFWLGQTPVTQQSYQRVTGLNRSHFEGFSLPVETVSWDEAQTYCRAIGGRLPTEAEWEYAARAGSTGARYDNPDVVAWHSENSGGHTHEVAKKSANAFGLYDMLGNVSQWVADWYGNYSFWAQGDPFGPESGTSRALRGGSWNRSPRVARVSFRDLNEPGVRSLNIGFRCAWE